jgi:hypothetical protein
MSFVCKNCGTVNTPDVLDDDLSEHTCSICNRVSLALIKNPCLGYDSWMCMDCFTTKRNCEHPESTDNSSCRMG